MLVTASKFDKPGVMATAELSRDEMKAMAKAMVLAAGEYGDFDFASFKKIFENAVEVTIRFKQFKKLSL